MTRRGREGLKPFELSLHIVYVLDYICTDPLTICFYYGIDLVVEWLLWPEWILHIIRLHLPATEAMVH